MRAKDAWPGNFAPITLGDRVCFFQGTYLCTGNHNFRFPGFELRLGSITIGSDTWIGAVPPNRDHARQPCGCCWGKVRGEVIARPASR